MRTVDVQSFAGAFTLGAVQSGFELVGKREMIGGFGVPSIEANRHIVGDNWKTQVSAPEEWEPVEAEFVLGTPPCSGFSLLNGSKQGKARGIDSTINACMWAFAEYAAKCPGGQVFAFESVMQAYSQGKELMQALHARVEELTGEQWTLTHVLQNSYSLGGAAMRVRYFWVVHKIPVGFEPPTPDRLPTAREVLQDLEGLGDTWNAQPYKRAPSWWSADRQHLHGVVDGHVTLKNAHTRRLNELLASGEWFPGENEGGPLRRAHDAGRLPEHWQRRINRLIEWDFDPGWRSTKRWWPERAARVITGNACGESIHPTEPRTFTLREAFRIQGFPDDWTLAPLRTDKGAWAYPGKGLPVEAGRWLATWVYRSLNDEPGTWTGEQVGDREFIVDVRDRYRLAKVNPEAKENR